MTTPKRLLLKNFHYPELFTPDGLKRLDQAFLAYLKRSDHQLAVALSDYRRGKSLSLSYSPILIETARYLEQFIAQLFSITDHVKAIQNAYLKDKPIFRFKQMIVQRLVKRRLHEPIQASFHQAHERLWRIMDLPNHPKNQKDLESHLAQFALEALEQKEQDPKRLELVLQWCVLAITTEKGQQFVSDWVSFQKPQKTDFEKLIPLEPTEHDQLAALQSPKALWHQRDGFRLTDSGMTARQVMNEVHYCIYCHKNAGDFCSRGFPVKKPQPDLGLKYNPLGQELIGCPLDEKISEMHLLKRDGYVIAPLAVIMIDNPMLPATGHRICNDCMKACIYQKQQPVNIPEIETRVLKDVLSLPWGVEIYDLLTRWNPLHPSLVYQKPYNGKKILVMGMGPAGFTVAHYLLMEGFAVVGADGLKIEPMDSSWLTEPICDYKTLSSCLSERKITGFGGVAEYGITVRWDKNFLQLIYLSLMRRSHFQILGNVRFGGTLTIEDAWHLGLDHLAIAVGAGLPRELPIENSLAPGMRQANDFLMALQLGGMGKANSLSQMQIRMPVVVIGGGLTGVDAATEVQAYYLKQIEKTASRYRVLVEAYGDATLHAKFSAHDQIILKEFLAHADLVAKERVSAEQEKRPADLIGLLHQFGGTSIIYRKRVQDSPAYRKNPEELAKAMEEGLFYLEHLSPVAVILDECGDCLALKCQSTIDHKESIIPARTILVATGAKPNVAYAFEHKNTLARQGFEYQSYQNINQMLQEVVEHPSIKSQKPQGMLTSYAKGDYRVTFLGDTHTRFHGSVVKAMASAKHAFLAIQQLLASKLTASKDEDYLTFRQRIDHQFKTQLVAKRRLARDVIELVVESPQAALKYRPGQFYRLQNFETEAQTLNDTLLQTESVALLASKVPNHPTYLAFLVFECGASSRLLNYLTPGQPLALMGPTGVRTSIPDKPTTVMMIGNRLAIAHLRALAPALKQVGHRVVFVGVFESPDEVICRQTLEQHVDQITWIFKKLTPFSPVRAQDSVYEGELESGLKTSIHQEHLKVLCQATSKVMVVGHHALLADMKRMRARWLDQAMPKAQWYASVYSTMQCMLKGVCAQCLQWQIDPITGQRTKAVYACSWQDQPFEKVDIDHLEQRLVQNSLQERLTDLWLSHILNSPTKS